VPFKNLFCLIQKLKLVDQDWEGAAKFKFLTQTKKPFVLKFHREGSRVNSHDKIPYFYIFVFQFNK